MSGSYPLTALGMVNALGSTQTAIKEALFSKEAHTLSRRDDLLYDRPIWVGEVSSPLPVVQDERYNCRNNQILLQAAEQIDEALQNAKERWGPARIGVVLGTSTTGVLSGEQAMLFKKEHGSLPAGFDYFVQEMGTTSQYLAAHFGLKGPCYTISTACSSSARVFASGRNLLASGMCDALIIGGADALSQITTCGFAALGAISAHLCQPMSASREGINIGEGAALFLMERDTSHQGVKLLGVGDASDAYHISAPEPEGTGAIASMQAALEDAGLSAHELDYINMHGTGTRLNDAMESKAIASLFGEKVPCSATKPLVGHMLGAAGATEAGFCWLLAQEWRRQKTQGHPQSPLIPHIWDHQPDPALAPIRLVQPGETISTAQPTFTALSNSFAFGGSNCTVIVGVEEEAKAEAQR